MPVPPLVNPPVPWMTPEKVVLWLLLPRVSVFAPSRTEPAPAREPMVTPGGLCVLRSSFAFPFSAMLAVPPVDVF